eukprot:CAMPEP_0113968262 /NCGR_PEP_ID=MMETSP0011_2-20120614/9424_1 /TAXON_ID=101924 /ORGANISM="Rhodosorus marinus" /LENGTH=108 /DNA_ID=CAMNT_0000981309 /DNA_START=253 /DNA_END=579 /DNA_ORIENTATION=+ /assembly_acc=CAM_ASM_000156
MDDEYEPSNAANFLNRYHSWRMEKQATSPPTSPTLSSPHTAQKRNTTKDVWSSVFHPNGRAPTGASRYDAWGRSSKETSPKIGGGESMSEIHDYSKMKQISLDDQEPR